MKDKLHTLIIDNSKYFRLEESDIKPLLIKIDDLCNLTYIDKYSFLYVIEMIPSLINKIAESMNIGLTELKQTVCDGRMERDLLIPHVVLSIENMVNNK